MPDHRLRRVAALSGIAFVILQNVAQAFIQVGGLEPSFGAPPADIVAFFEARDPALYEVGAILIVAAGIALLWFGGLVWRESSRAEGESAWLSAIGFGAVLLTVAVGAIGSIGWPLAMFRVEQGLDPLLAQLQFDLSNLAFAGTWVTFASFIAATSLVAARADLLPRWLVWLGWVTVVGLLAARVGWATSQLVFIPFVASWIWTIALSVVLYRRIGRESPAPTPARSDDGG